MRLLLTGADGFTGRHFAQYASNAGHTVVPLHADLQDREALHAEVLQVVPQAVVHLAAISFVGYADVSAFYSVNVIGTMNLLEALVALPQRPQRVLLASSANIYGNCEQSPIAENQAPAPVNHYAISKLAMEHMARTYAKELPLVITRPFNYTGPGQSKDFVIPKLVDHFARRAPSISLGNLQVEREFNDVRMLCDAYLQLLQHGVTGETYNVCSGQPYSLEFVIAELQRLTGHPIRVEVNPAFVRANEMYRLFGDPSKLDTLLATQGKALVRPVLTDILQRMLQAASTD